MGVVLLEDGVTSMEESRFICFQRSGVKSGNRGSTIQCHSENRRGSRMMESVASSRSMGRSEVSYAGARTAPGYMPPTCWQSECEDRMSSNDGKDGIAPCQKADSEASSSFAVAFGEKGCSHGIDQEPTSKANAIRNSTPFLSRSSEKPL